MKTKPVNPYQRLVNEAREWIFSVRHPHQVYLFRYPEASVQTKSWRLNELYQRVKAADQLGYYVTAEALNDGSLQFSYVKRPSSPPWPIDPDN